MLYLYGKQWLTSPLIPAYRLTGKGLQEGGGIFENLISFMKHENALHMAPEHLGIEYELELTSDNYESLIECLSKHEKINNRVDTSFHFLKYHDCIDREKDFLEVLKSHLVQYCFPKHRYEGKGPSEICKLAFEGRDKFFNPKSTPTTPARKGRSGASRSGELGEIALYFLLETFLKAPQIVSKMSLKTTGGENIKGSDGIHIGIVDGKKCVFYCESKLNKVKNTAFTDCIDSVIKFREDKKDFEISIINNHIDIKEPLLKQAVLDFLNPSKPKEDDWLEIHACFVGFNWDEFAGIEEEPTNDELMQRIRKELLKEVISAKKFLENKLQPSSNRLRYYFFVMPFKDIESLRSNFLKSLYGAI